MRVDIDVVVAPLDAPAVDKNRVQAVDGRRMRRVERVHLAMEGRCRRCSGCLPEEGRGRMRLSAKMTVEECHIRQRTRNAIK